MTPLRRCSKISKAPFQKIAALRPRTLPAVRTRTLPRVASMTEPIGTSFGFFDNLSNPDSPFSFTHTVPEAAFTSAVLASFGSGAARPGSAISTTARLAARKSRRAVKADGCSPVPEAARS